MIFRKKTPRSIFVSLVLEIISFASSTHEAIRKNITKINKNFTFTFHHEKIYQNIRIYTHTPYIQLQMKVLECKQKNLLKLFLLFPVFPWCWGGI